MPPTEHSQPASRTWVKWTPDLLEAAELQAGSGALWLAAHLCYSLRADDRVRACLLQLGGLASLPVTWEHQGDGRRVDRVETAIGADFPLLAPEEELVQLVQTASLLGFAIAHLRWTRDPETGRRLPILEAWDPRLVRWDPELGWIVWTCEGDAVIAEENAGKYPGWVVYTPFGASQPWQYGAWRAVARWWLLKQYAESDWARLSEKAGGLWAVSSDSPLSDKDRVRLAEALASMGRDAAVALPATCEAMLLQLAAGAHVTFVDQVTQANLGISVALLGQNLTTEVQGGSHAAAEVHERVSGVVVRSLAKPLAKTLRLPLNAWARWNFNDAGPVPVWVTEPPSDATAVAAAQSAAAAAVAAWRALGVDVDEVASAQAAGLTLRSTTLLPKPAPPAANPNEPPTGKTNEQAA